MTTHGTPKRPIASTRPSPEKSNNLDAKTVGRFVAHMPFFRIDYRFGVIVDDLVAFSQAKRVHNQPPFTAFSEFEANHEARRSDFSKWVDERMGSPSDNSLDTAILHQEFLLQLPKEAFSAAHVREHFRLLQVALLAIQATPDEYGPVLFKQIASNIVLIAIHCLAVLTSRDRQDLCDNLRDVLLTLRDDLDDRLAAPNRFSPSHIDLYNTLGCGYALFVRTSGGLVQPELLNRLLQLRLKFSALGWYNLPSRLKVDHALLCLHLTIAFFPLGRPFHTTFGISHNTFEYLRNTLTEARETLTDPYYTIEGVVLDWFTNKINQDVFVHSYATPQCYLLRCLSAGEHGMVRDLAERFASYRYPVTVERIYAFLGQFEQLDLIKAALRMLTRIKYIPLSRLSELVEESLSEMQAFPQKACVVPLGDVAGSTAIVGYLAAHASKRSPRVFESVEAALEQTSRSVKLVFADDSCISGTQAIHTIQELLGARELKPHHTRHAVALPKRLRQMFLARKVAFSFAVGVDYGMQMLSRELPALGLQADPIRACYREHLEDKPFQRYSSWTWADRSEMESLRRKLSSAGFQLLAQRATVKKWSEERRKESVLGFSDFQRMLVFEHNVPKTTITVLWEAGEVDGRRWTPLFPVTD
jgi:hypothetical protein